ncbi:MAG: YqhA family protein [Alcanivoracaceae bacterium]|jgi:uncharacterized membrane protein YqhA
MLEKLFDRSRLLVFVAVFISAMAAVLLYVVSFNLIFTILIDSAQSLPGTADEGKRLAVRLLKVLDIVMIAVTFQIMAAGLHRLFISPDSQLTRGLLATLTIESFHDLKTIVIQIAIVILVVLFLEQAVDKGATLETLYFGLAAGFVSVCFAWASEHLGRHRRE